MTEAKSMLGRSIGSTTRRNRASASPVEGSCLQQRLGDVLKSSEENDHRKTDAFPHADQDHRRKAHAVLCRKSISGRPTATMAWVMMPIVGSRRNFHTIPIVASDEITGKK